jgi:hypothetical protein
MSTAGSIPAHGAAEELMEEEQNEDTGEVEELEGDEEEEEEDSDVVGGKRGRKVLPLESIADVLEDGSYACRNCDSTWSAEQAIIISAHSVRAHENGAKCKKGGKKLKGNKGKQRAISCFFRKQDDEAGSSSGVSIFQGNGESDVMQGGSSNNERSFSTTDILGGDGSTFDLSTDMSELDSAVTSTSSCAGYVPDLRDVEGGLLHLSKVYPWHRHTSADDVVCQWLPDASSGAIHALQCTGAVEGEASGDSCGHCSGLLYKPALQKILETACQDYREVECLNHEYLNDRQKDQKINVFREKINTLRLERFNLQKKLVVVCHRLKTWKKIQLCLANEDIPGVR